MAAMAGTEHAAFLDALTTEECMAELARTSIGRVGFVVDDRPLVLPVNYAANRQGTIVFRTAEHSVLTNVEGHAVAFEIDGYDQHTRTGWSVCVQGCAHEFTDDPEADRPVVLTVLSWAPGARDRWFAITADQVTGRRIPMDRAATHDWFPGII
jgi:nitroimidazol reductase NimA-like FMN-containing flavoprotein (pyridoxamine 5'-phosphate oxidase superfamily)